MIAVLVAAIALLVIWSLGGEQEAYSEFLAKISATAAITLAFPIAYLIRLFRVPAAIHQELQGHADDVTTQLKMERDRRPLMVVDVLRAPVHTMYGRAIESVVFRVRNLGDAAHFSGQIEFSGDDNTHNVMQHYGIYPLEWENAKSESVELKHGQAKDVVFVNLYRGFVHLNRLALENQIGAPNVEIRLTNIDKAKSAHAIASVTVSSNPRAINGYFQAKIRICIEEERSVIEEMEHRFIA